MKSAGGEDYCAHARDNNSSSSSGSGEALRSEVISKNIYTAETMITPTPGNKSVTVHGTLRIARTSRTRAQHGDRSIASYQ
jgi:hypothetical protein